MCQLCHSKSSRGKNCLFAVVCDTCECKPYWLSELDVLGSHASVGVLKVWVLDVWSKFFALQGEVGSWGFHPNCMGLCQGWGLCETVPQRSYPFWRCEYSLICLMCRSHQVVSEFLSKGLAACIAVHSGVRGRREVQEPSLLPSWSTLWWFPILIESEHSREGISGIG